MQRLAIALLFATAASAQINGPYPGPGGRSPIPPGTQPGGLPIPTRRNPPRASTSPFPDAEKIYVDAGTLRRITRKEMVLEADDHRLLFYRIGDDLRLDEDDFAPGDQLDVTSVSDDEGYLTATVVTLTEKGSPDQRATAEHPVDATPLRPEPPDLKDDTAIAAARQATAEFLESLPSFQVRRNTTRYVQESARGQWRALDVVTSTLAYRDGAEAYADVRIGNKKTDKPLSEIDGLRSTGEFGEIIGDLFHPETAAAFSAPSRVDLHGRRAWKYRFEVSRERSIWRIATPGQHYFSAYGGAIWIDYETNRVLRIELQARNLPKAFPFDTVEMTVDYDFVRLDAGRQFLLPTESEALNCIRGTSVCMRNATSFRNYVKFNAESGIIFEEPK
jgi:hypothetical protein